MSIKSRKFQKGIRTKPTTDAATLEGEQRTDSADNKQKIFLDSAERAVVTEDQSQDLSNKSIDADNNTISNLETDNLKAGVLNTDLSGAATDTEIPSALAVKTALEGQNEASEINYDNSTSGLAATDVQAAIDEVEGRVESSETALSDHLIDAVDAHDASAISNAPTGNLVATDVQGALDELQSEIDALPAKSETLQNKTLDSTNTISGSIETPTRLDVKQDTEANLITYAATASDGQLCFATDTLKMYQVITNELQPVGGGGSTSFEIDQTAHGLTVGSGIYHNGTIYVDAQANNASTLAYHTVVEVIDANTFVAADFGRIEVLAHGFTIGEYYFQSEATAGLPTITQPVSGYSNPLFYVEDANTLQIKCLRPSPVGDTTNLDEIADVSVPAPEDGQVLTYNLANLRWEAVDASGGSSYEIVQAAHGLSVGEGIYHNGTSFVKARSDNSATLAYYVVIQVIDAGIFVAADMTRVEVPTHGFTIGQFYWLSDSVAGQATNVEPSSGFSNPLFYVESSEILQIKCYRPDAIQGISLDDLDNVSVAAPTDKQVLAYNNSNSTWEAQDAVSAAADVTYDNATSGLVASDVQAAIDEVVATPELNKLTDVTITDRKDGQVLKYDEAADQIINAPISFNMLANHEDMTPTLVSVTATKDAAVFLPIDVNTQSMRITFAGAAGDYLQEAPLNAELDGLQGVLRAWVKTDQDNVELSSTIDGVAQSTVTVISTNKWRQYEIPIVMSGTNMGIQISSASSITGNVYLDQVELEIAKASQELGTAHFVGSLTYPTQANCAWTNSSSSPASYPADADCSTVDIIGNVAKPDTQIPAVKIPNARTDGYYKVIANGFFFLNSGTNALFRLDSDGMFGGFAQAYQTLEARTASNLQHQFRYETSGDKQVEIQTQVTGGQAAIQASQLGRALYLSVYFFPDASSTIAVQKSQSPNYAGFLSFSFMDGDLQGHLPADGRCVAKNLYPDYDKRVANLYGDCDAGTGANTGYNLPDMRGYFPRMVDTTSEGTAGVNPDNTVLGGKQADQNASHAHTLSGFASRGFVSGPSVIGSSTANTTYNSGSSGGNEARPSAISLMAYVRMSDNNLVVGSFEQIRSDDLVLVEASGNNGNAITASTNVTFLETSDIQNTWNGSVFTAPKDGIYTFTGSERIDLASAQTVVTLHKNNSASGKLIGIDQGTNVVIVPFSGSLYLLQGETASIRIDKTTNITNVSAHHHLTITQLPTKESIVANLMQGQTTKCQTKVLQANVSGAGNVPSLSFNNLTIGKKYRYSIGMYVAQQNISSNFKEIGIGIDNGTKRLGFLNTRYPVNTSYWSPTLGHARNFTAIDSSLDLGILYNSNMAIYGSTTNDNTFIELCELPDTVIETDEW